MATDVSAVVNHFPVAENGFTTTLASTITSGATTVPLNSVAGYANGDIAVFVVDPSDASKKQTFTGVIDTSGVQVTGVKWTAGTNQVHSGGATVVDYVTATHMSMMTKGLMNEHLQTGAHGAVTATSLAVSGTTSLTGALTIKSYDGWINTADTWVYASATSFTISAVDRTAQFPVGTKIKLTQTTAKYFYVTSTSFSTNTTVNITGGSTYTLANAAITSPALSYDANPQGHPIWLASTPTYGGFSADPTSTARFCVNGRTCIYKVHPTAVGTSNSVNFTISAPITSANTNDNRMQAGDAADSGTATAATLLLPANSATITLHKGVGSSGGNWTNSGNKFASFVFVYEI